MEPLESHGGHSVWAISPEERDKHDKQFDTLSPAMGYVSGEQAKKFFLQSGLPSSVLAEIWSLADMNKDGKMDKLEFSVAMKLVKLKLQGTPLPSSLPIIMKQPPVPAPNPASAMSSSRFGMGSMPNLSVMSGGFSMLTPINSNLSPMTPMTSLTPINSNLSPMTPMTSLTPMNSNLSPMTTMTSLTPLVPMGAGLAPMVATSMTPMPLRPSLGSPALSNGTMGVLQNLPPVNMATGMPLPVSYNSPLGFSPGMNKATSLLDLGSSSSNSSSITSLVGSSPKTAPSDWAVPQASRLKYRQQFNTLDKNMTGYLTGQQVRNAMATTQLTQTQLAAIWNLADVDKDGKLSGEEFILAMHLVDVAKTSQPLPLTLPTELIPPSQRVTMNGNSISPYGSITEGLEAEPAQKTKSNLSFEDKFKANLERGNAELEKRRQVLQDAQRREEEKRQQKEREERERMEREAREQEERRRKEEELRLERQRELERQKEEERLKELERKEAAQRELERQRKEEWERRRRAELQSQKNREQQEICTLKARKRSLEMELEAVGNKHRQISERLRDAQTNRKVQQSELEMINQRRDARRQDINSLQRQLEEYQRKLSQLTPEQQRLSDKLRNMGLNNLPASTMTTLKLTANEKDGACRKLKQQLDALEQETATKLADMDQYQNDLQDLRESRIKQESALEKLRSIKASKRRELERQRELEEEMKRKEEEKKRMEEEEALRRIKLEKERQWQEKLQREEDERRRRLQEEREAKLREEEEKEKQARLLAAKEQAERERRAKEEEERREQERRLLEERRKREEVERKKREEETRKLEEERKRKEEERREEERRRQEEKRRQEEEDRQRREEELKRLEEERLEREKEEEERRRQRAAEAAIRDAEERKRVEEERKRREEENRRKQEAERKKREEERKRQDEAERARREEERRRQEEVDRTRAEEERRRKDEDERKLKEEAKRKLEEEKRRREEAARQQVPVKMDIHEKLSALLRGIEERKGGLQPQATAHRKSAALTSFRALYPFTARNQEELSFEADDLIEVDESTEREQGWLYGMGKAGTMGWFPESYVERVAEKESPVAAPITANAAAPTAAANAVYATVIKKALKPQLSITDKTGKPGGDAAVPTGQNSAFTPTHAPHPTSSEQIKVVGNVQAQALCSWTAKTESHLNFSKDDVIQVLEQQESWWLGELNGVQGWFPKSYVTLLEDDDSTNPTFAPADGSEATDEYVALYTYESPEPGDLTFNEGDVILVTQREGEWWSGGIGNRTGVFPSNYVKPKEPDTSSNSGKPGQPGKKTEIAQVSTVYTATGTEQLSLAPGNLILILSKNATGWWLGELQARGKKRQKGWFPASHVKMLGSNSGKSTPAPQPVCQVIAMYDYKAANGDEISFSKGQLISVFEKNDPDWWKGEVNGVTGLFPTNYVTMTTTETDPSQQWCADLNTLDSLTPQERKRQGYIHELIQTEERYVQDLELVMEVFHKPMSESGRLTDAEMAMIFANWKELIACNTKLLKALRVRKKMGGDNMPVQVIGDILASELAHLQPYIRFCSCQLNGAALVQSKTDGQPDFKNFLKKIATDYRCKGMPLSSFLLKPMQRITRYPLHIKNILESTQEGHVDRGPLREALERAEELCSQVNEGVREKENADRLEWIQAHVQCDGIAENLVFNSLTNCLGPRKLLHSGKVYKTKSNKELWAFLFSDFLLLTHTGKQFISSGPDKLFSTKNNIQLKMYKPPVFLNEILVKLPDPSSEEPFFHISHIDRVYSLKTDNINERTAWVQKIKAASEDFLETDKKKREKAYHSRSMKASGIGRLLVTILEATELKSGKNNGKSNPYCEVTMGAQIYTSRTLNDTTNPKWNFNCQFNIKDLYQDVLCITIFEREQFSPDEFLGRTEVPVATIKKELENKGSATRRLLLHEVPTGEVWVRLDLQLFQNKASK